MARPKLGNSETERLHLKITADEITAIDDWRYSNRIPTRSEAVRRLCRIALQTEGPVFGVINSAHAFLDDNTEKNLFTITYDEKLKAEIADKYFAMLFDLSIRALELETIVTGMREGASFEEATEIANTRRQVLENVKNGTVEK